MYGVLPMAVGPPHHDLPKVHDELPRFQRHVFPRARDASVSINGHPIRVGENLKSSLVRLSKGVVRGQQTTKKHRFGESKKRARSLKEGSLPTYM
jgi:hypothetical protein